MDNSTNFFVIFVLLTFSFIHFFIFLSLYRRNENKCP